MKPLAVAVLVGFAFGAYLVLRYLGLWMEVDTTEFVRYSERVQTFGPSGEEGYPHGYAYTTWVAVVSSVTGVPPMALYQRYTPLLGNVLLAVFAFVTFRHWLRSERLGLAAAVTCFLVPELVFSVSRGNHEKFTTALTLLSALALLKVLRLAQARSAARWFAPWLITFYLVAFTAVTMNVLFGSMFVVASTLALGFVWLLRRRAPRMRARLGLLRRELPPMVTTGWVWVLFVLFYLYPSSSDNLALLADALEGLSEMAQSFSPAVDPYATIQSAWAGPVTYGVVSSFRWVLFVVSFVTWCAFLARFLRAPERVGVERLTLMAYYGAFGLLLAASIPVDFVGLAAGSNLQVRLYTYFALFAAPMAVAGVAAWSGRVRLPRPRWPWMVMAGMAMSSFALISVLKATVDPSVSNRWIFYRPAELTAMSFWDERHSFDWLWVGATPRVLYAYRAVQGRDSVSQNHFNRAPASYLDRDGHALASDVVVAEAVASSVPLSPILADDLVYDNGEARIHARLPRTPFQR